MGIFEKFFKPEQPQAAVPPKKEKGPALPKTAEDIESDRAALEFIGTVRKQGITDKNVIIEKVVGQSTTEERERKVEPTSYARGNRGGL